jgi:hypothetical protein
MTKFFAITDPYYRLLKSIFRCAGRPFRSPQNRLHFIRTKPAAKENSTKGARKVKRPGFNMRLKVTHKLTQPFAPLDVLFLAGGATKEEPEPQRVELEA